jgi:hypothetical protein
VYEKNKTKQIIEPKSSKDRAMYEGVNPSFTDELKNLLFS